MDNQSNPFADWNPHEEEIVEQNKSRTKTELEDIYYKSRKKKTQLQEIQSFNDKFQEFTLEENSGEEQSRYKNVEESKFDFFQDKNLLNQAQMSFKELGKTETLFMAGIHLIILILGFFIEKNIVFYILHLNFQIILLVILKFHRKKTIFFLKSIQRSQFLSIQMLIIILCDIYSLWFFSNHYILMSITCLSIVFDIIRVKKLSKLYIAQKLIEDKPSIESQEFEQFDNFE